MSIVINGKVKAKNVTRKFVTFNTTDGRQWPDEKIANKWQQKLNKTAQDVLDGKTTMNGTRKPRKASSSPRRTYTVVSVSKRLAIQRFVNQSDTRVGSSPAVVSMNRLLQSLQTNPKLLVEFNKLLTAK